MARRRQAFGGNSCCSFIYYRIVVAGEEHEIEMGSALLGSVTRSSLSHRFNKAQQLLQFKGFFDAGYVVYTMLGDVLFYKWIRSVYCWEGDRL